MSTRKVKDGTVNKTSITTKSKKPTIATKSDISKTRTKPKTQIKKSEEDDDKKIKKTNMKITQNHKQERLVSKTANTKKIGNVTKTSSSRPVTPPSSRVSKTQFFPSKKMYSNALKDINTQKISSTLKNEENYASSDTSSTSERPKTATLRKGSIVNNNIVGPEASKKTKTRVIVDNGGDNISKKGKAPVIIYTKERTNTSKRVEASAIDIKEMVDDEIRTPVPSTNDVEYEDDFNSYESDFEEYDSSDSTVNLSAGTTSTESSESDTVDLTSVQRRLGSASTDDERKLDSGNYELPDAKHKQILDNIKESIEKENANFSANHNRSNTGSLSDEGFEEGRSLQFINFLGAQKKYKHRKSVELRRKRGEEILSMIRLDHYSFTLFDLAPVPYDTFIKSFGKSNTVQVSVQTGDDHLNEEIQTDAISVENKWTQFPPSFEMFENDDNFWGKYRSNYLGVGGDTTDEIKIDNLVNDNGLEKFLLSTGNLIIDLLAEEKTQITAETDKSNFPFSKGFILCHTQQHEVLKHRPIKDVIFCSNKILTIHSRKNGEFDKSFVCLWNLSNLESPEMFFVAYGHVTSCTFNTSYSSLIFGGLNNGSIVVWDINEHSRCHSKLYNDENGNEVFRSPTYSTEIDYGHSCKIISIQCMIKKLTEMNLFDSSKGIIEVCSLDEEGNIIVWSVIFKQESQGKITERQGLAHWGSVIITINTKIELNNLYPEIDDFRCTALGLSHFDSSNLYISTNYGIIVHCLSSGAKTTVKKFFPDTQTQANCLEMCPFSPQYFMVGFDNGDVNFYSRDIERPLMIFSNKDTVEGKTKIQMIQWSHNRPFIFYTKNVSNTIDIWNLKVSDMIPIFSIPFKDKVLSMKLSPITGSGGGPDKTYMIITTENGVVYVHLLNNEHDRLPNEEFEKDKRKFLNYINMHI